MSIVFVSHNFRTKTLKQPMLCGLRKKRKGYPKEGLSIYGID